MKTRFVAAIMMCALALSACRILRAGQAPDPARPTSTGAAPAPAATLPPTAAPTPLPSPTLAPTEPAIAPLTFVAGRNDYVIEVDGTPREFIVYVPAGYAPNTPTPVVFMFHGSNQSGRVMYENTAWAAKAEAENFIVVYPTSWKYRLTDSNRVEDKWNVSRLYTLVVPGTELKDDVKFVRVMIDTLKVTFNVDEARLYATGFSNGGGFVLTRLIPEMNDVFAAYAVSGAALFGGSEVAIDDISTAFDASLYCVMGTNDEKISEGSGHPLPFPIVAEEIAADPLFGQMFALTTTLLGLENSYTVAYERPAYVTFTFNQSPTGAGNQFIFRMVNNMGHVYPSGNNNRWDLNVSDLFWEFFLQYTQT